jgi:DNA-binding NarL/FixJ family response regulator
LEVLTLMAEGLANREIGSRLSITEGTVKLHTNSIFRKLGVTNRLQAVLALQREPPEFRE